jgi:uncharacterized protein YkwD
VPTFLHVTTVRARAIRLVAVLVLSLCAPFLATSSSAMAGTVTETSYAHSVFNRLNNERAAHGLAPLTWRGRLVSSARAHNLAMARANTMSHQLPGEPDLAKRISATGYRWSWIGENIAYNTDISRSGVLLLQTMMYREKPPNDGHRQNILSRNFRNVGIDVYIDRTHHKVWLTEDFGAH